MAFRMLACHSIPPPHKHAWLRMLWLARKDGCFQFLLVIGSSSGNPLCSAIKLGGVKADILMLSLRARRRDSNSFECILPNLTPERGNVNVPKRRMSYAPPGSLVQPDYRWTIPRPTRPSAQAIKKRELPLSALADIQGQTRCPRQSK